ncbi:MAG: diacylglycerol kinase family lipid kinase [Porphyromonadaceae bacterium]|nr:diacylglycerol kinase family lipid kinase [Porphyromonadaceae bacterium]
MSEEIITSNHWLVITNPTAGKRRFKEQSKYICSELEKAQVPYIFKVTEYSGHAIEIARYYARRNCLNFMILGGDGSVSEVINGIFAAEPENSSEIRIAIFPRGTGNDWGRFWKLKKNDRESLKVFFKGKTKLIDIGQIEYQNKNSEQNFYYFINSVGFGLDAEVVDLTHRLKKYLGSFSLLYTIALLLAVFRYKTTNSTLEINDKSYPLRLFTMNIANGPYTGGGIKQNPFALPYDGVFDMMIAEKPSFKDIITALPLIFNGSLTKHPVIKTLQTKEILIQVEKEIKVEADGIIVPNAHNCRVSILPEAIRMIVP